MGKHRKPVKRWAPYVTAGVALPAAGLLGGALYVGDGNLSTGANLLATSIFVDGTKSITGTEEGNPPYRMADALQGRYSDGDGTAFDEQFVFYPRSLGPATGPGDPTYDVSEGLATQQVVDLVRAAKEDDDYHAGDKIYVVGYSQGAGGAAAAIPQLEDEGLADDVEFVLAANPRRNDGGILTRVPAGVYLPVFGVTFGGGTAPETAKVLQVTKQYDGVGDAPNYLFNIAADANAVAGYYYLHPGYYKDIDPTPDPTRTDAIVTTSADGKITDVLIKSPDGQLPLTRPLLQLGVPQSLVTALDPFLRSVIETGYSRPTGPGSYRSEPVPFQLAPPPTQWLSDIQSVAAGALQTTQRLTTVGLPAAPVAPLTAGSRSAALDTPPAPPAKDDGVKLDTEEGDKTLTGTGTNKVEPPKGVFGGWKPGDVLRSIFGPKPTDGESTKADPPSDPAPAPASPGTDDPAPANNADAGPSGTPSQ
ncbi:MAG: hypothetical protein QOD39_2346 [Mycobacterium sp.]|nr:hypothetical protein [Mycobacterium sp.]